MSPGKKPATRSLETYRRKRQFDRTPEPSGKATATRGQSAAKAAESRELIFCVQKHLATQLHYDFRLEHNSVLLSWAVPKGPSLNPRDKRLAMMVEDHPRDYADFEGVIPEGYGAGIVMLWDTGRWWADEESQDVDAALAKGELKFHLDGYKLKGGWVLVRTRGAGRYAAAGSNDSPQRSAWLLIKHRDNWSGEVDVIKEAPLSVKSGGDFPQILLEQQPESWKAHRPSRGGATGKLLEKIIREAAELQIRNPKPEIRNESGKTKKRKK